MESKQGQYNEDVPLCLTYMIFYFIWRGKNPCQLSLTHTHTFSFIKETRKNFGIFPIVVCVTVRMRQNATVQLYT